MKRQGYSRSMVKNTLFCLSGALGCVVYPYKYIKYNPYGYARIPKIVMSDGAKVHTEYICVKEDFAVIIERLGPNSNFHASLMTGHHCGTHLGEVYGIDLLHDVDLERHIITTQHQLTNEGGEWYYRPPKYNSVRIIKIFSEYEKILKTEIHNRKKNMPRYGRYLTKTYRMDDDLIFQAPSNVRIIDREIISIGTRENGEPLTPYPFGHCVKVIHRKLGNPLFYSHCLRHTHSTLLAENGARPKIAMERLGHKDIRTTMDHYVLSTERVQNDTIVVLAGTIPQQSCLPLKEAQASSRQDNQNKSKQAY